MVSNIFGFAEALHETLIFSFHANMFLVKITHLISQLNLTMITVYHKLRHSHPKNATFFYAPIFARSGKLQRTILLWYQRLEMTDHFMEL